MLNLKTPFPSLWFKCLSNMKLLSEEIDNKYWMFKAGASWGKYALSLTHQGYWTWTSDVLLTSRHRDGGCLGGNIHCPVIRLLGFHG